MAQTERKPAAAPPMTNAEKIMLDALEELSRRDPHSLWEQQPHRCQVRVEIGPGVTQHTMCDGCLARYVIRKAKEAINA